MRYENMRKREHEKYEKKKKMNGKREKNRCSQNKWRGIL
jgi:hypothetical protein